MGAWRRSSRRPTMWSLGTTIQPIQVDWYQVCFVQPLTQMENPRPRHNISFALLSWMEPRLALTKNGNPYYLAKETKKKMKAQEDVTNTSKSRSSRHKMRSFRVKRRGPGWITRRLKTRWNFLDKYGFNKVWSLQTQPSPSQVNSWNFLNKYGTIRVWIFQTQTLTNPCPSS